MWNPPRSAKLTWGRPPPTLHAKAPARVSDALLGFPHSHSWNKIQWVALSPHSARFWLLILLGIGGFSAWSLHFLPRLCGFSLGILTSSHSQLVLMMDGWVRNNSSCTKLELRCSWTVWGNYLYLIETETEIFAISIKPILSSYNICFDTPLCSCASSTDMQAYFLFYKLFRLIWEKIHKDTNQVSPALFKATSV